MKKQLLMELFENDEQLFNATIEELDGYNGYLGDDRYYEMECIDEFYNNADPLELLQRAYFGRDADNWYTDSRGDKVYGAFNPNRDYFRYNGYGNLVSTNYKDYSVHLDDYFIQAIIENQNYLYLDDEIVKILEVQKNEKL
jgi:hypothetical protein